METTRGDSPSAPGFTRAKEEDRLAAAILAGLDRGGSVTIPVFALGKTQEVLAMLWRMRKRGVIPETALTIGGLSTKISEVYDALSQDGQRMLPDLKLLDELDPFVLGGDDIAGAQVSRRAIYALSSGMMSENTVSNIFARKIIPDDKQSLFFVGYSDPSSPAARLRAAKHGDLVVLDERLAPVPKLCHTDSFTFSAHSSRETLLDYALRLAPKKILLTHGDRVAIEWFRSQLAIKLPATEVIVPEPGQPIEL